MSDEKSFLRFNHRTFHSCDPDNPCGVRPFPKQFLEKIQGFFLSLGLDFYRSSRQIADESCQFKFLSRSRRPVAIAYPLYSALDEKMPSDHWYCPTRD